MKYGDVNLGQIEAAINKLGGKDGLKRFLAGELKVVPKDAAGKSIKSSQPKVLVRTGDFSPIEINGRFDPKAFYQTRDSLYVWSNFNERIVAAAQIVEAGKKFGKVPRFKLVRNATGKMLKTARPKAVWNATDFYAWLAAKIDKQANGEAGELLNTGWANLFLVEGVGEVVVVYVNWNSVPRYWNLNTWRLGNEWNAGNLFASKPID